LMRLEEPVAVIPLMDSDWKPTPTKAEEDRAFEFWFRIAFKIGAFANGATVVFYENGMLETRFAIPSPRNHDLFVKLAENAGYDVAAFGLYKVKNSRWNIVAKVRPSGYRMKLLSVGGEPSEGKNEITSRRKARKLTSAS
jgi:hypothetical protein